MTLVREDRVVRAAGVSVMPPGVMQSSYARQNKLPYALMGNAAGNFVAPDDLTFAAAAAGADWSKSFYQILTNQRGKDAWPITGATFIMMHRVQERPENATAVVRFFDWAYENGSKTALELDYVPMPPSVVKSVRALWSEMRDTNGKPVPTK